MGYETGFNSFLLSGHQLSRISRFLILFHSARPGCSFGLILLVWILIPMSRAQGFLFSKFCIDFGVLHCRGDFSLRTSGSLL